MKIKMGKPRQALISRAHRTLGPDDARSLLACVRESLSLLVLAVGHVGASQGAVVALFRPALQILSALNDTARRYAGGLWLANFKLSW